MSGPDKIGEVVRSYVQLSTASRQPSQPET